MALTVYSIRRVLLLVRLFFVVVIVYILLLIKILPLIYCSSRLFSHRLVGLRTERHLQRLPLAQARLRETWGKRRTKKSGRFLVGLHDSADKLGHSSRRNYFNSRTQTSASFFILSFSYIAHLTLRWRRKPMPKRSSNKF